MKPFNVMSAVANKIMLNQNIIEEKKEQFLTQLSSTREISVRSYNNLLLLSENRLVNNNVLIGGMPLNAVLSFLENTINELSNSLYEEMASVSYDAIWLDGITDYLLRRFNKIKSLDIQKNYYRDSL